jgi:hypothetical protein
MNRNETFSVLCCELELEREVGIGINGGNLLYLKV